MASHRSNWPKTAFTTNHTEVPVGWPTALLVNNSNAKIASKEYLSKRHSYHIQSAYRRSSTVT